MQQAVASAADCDGDDLKLIVISDHEGPRSTHESVRGRGDFGTRAIDLFLQVNRQQRDAP